MKPMKPHTIEDESLLRFPLLGSAKIDGFRMRTADDGTAMTSSWKPIVNQHIQDVFGTLAIPGLDGEITVGKPNAPRILQKTSSGVTTVTGEPAFTFHVFDHFSFPSDPRVKRIERARKLVRGIPCIRMVKQTLIKDLAAFRIFNAWCIANGYEGAMYANPDGEYKFGRSTPREGLLWRYKPFVDSEFTIEDWFEQEHNGNESKADELGRNRRSSHKAGKTGKGVLGGFIGTDIHDGLPVRVGTGFTDAQRKAWWAMGLDRFRGQLGKYKKQQAGEADKPRHTIWLDFRDIADL